MDSSTSYSDFPATPDAPAFLISLTHQQNGTMSLPSYRKREKVVAVVVVVVVVVVVGAVVTALRLRTCAAPTNLRPYSLRLSCPRAHPDTNLVDRVDQPLTPYITAAAAAANRSRRATSSASTFINTFRRFLPWNCTPNVRFAKTKASPPLSP